jgi:murein DD-endopeptidase MepM/ murein hydrolase activator NlpD
MKRALGGRLILAVLLISPIAVLAAGTLHLSQWAQTPLPAVPSPRFEAMLVRAPEGPVEPRIVPIPGEIGSGETLGAILSRLELTPAEANAAVEAWSSLVDPRKLKAGQRYTVARDGEGRLLALELEMGNEGMARLKRAEDGWESEWHGFTRTVQVHRAAGVLETFLEAAVRDAGAPGEVAYAMSDVLQWDLDFTRDLRLGDRFWVLYESVFLDGRPAGVGSVVALAYENGGRRLEAYRFGEEKGYYDGEGRPIKKMFLRSPLRFSRVTSRFSHKRFHPILRRYRPHYGVDYAAPVGTPVRATANGVVVSAAWTKGGGRTVTLRHPNGYRSSYLHLSGFARGIGAGRRVVQGDIIGFVGSTGLSTGPHLDYRIQKNGRWMDPLTLRSEPAPPIPEAQRESFDHAREELRLALFGPDERDSSSGSGTRVAEIQPSDSTPLETH